MKPLELPRVTPELNDQLSFLIRREMYVKYFRYRNLIYMIAALLLIFVELLFLRETQTVVNARVVTIGMLSMLLLFLVIMFFVFLVKKQKRDHWKTRTIRKLSQVNSAIKFYFDEKRLLFKTESHTSEIKWEYYKYWAENKDSLFIIPEKDIYEAIYYSKSELGIDNYDDLKRIAGNKLEVLPKVKFF
ncbi:hypothetical protein [Pinibacter soli]|uniref:YcxB-like protein domain-containing protein n=1 Tax=Pinibacter soli TaxID=3044211 RepID=A0ABT6RDP5_9BACT|nr:hypothetical protein [Pinibacter soli]MDI3320596.1 hypothetical protein [Pinibacter soli]